MSIVTIGCVYATGAVLTGVAVNAHWGRTKPWIGRPKPEERSVRVRRGLRNLAISAAWPVAGVIGPLVGAGIVLFYLLVVLPYAARQFVNRHLPLRTATA